MSLTSQLALDGQISQFIRSSMTDVHGLLRRLDTISDIDAILPAHLSSKLSSANSDLSFVAYNYGMIGRAIDYRLRCYFAMDPGLDVAFTGAMMAANMWDRYERLLRDDDGLVNPIDYELVEDFFGGPRSEGAFSEIVKRLGVHKGRPIKTSGPKGPIPLQSEDERLVNQYCVVLAYFEDIFRNGIDKASRHSPILRPEPKRSITQLLSLAESDELDDLSCLSQAFYETQSDLLRHKSRTHVHPHFDGSKQIEGADGDIVIDGCLIDFKTTKNPTNEVSKGLSQVAGYVLLDYSDTYSIRSVGIYLARQKALLTWTVEELLGVSSPDDLHEMRMAFENVVSGVTGRNRDGRRKST